MFNSLNKHQRRAKSCPKYWDKGSALTPMDLHPGVQETSPRTRPEQRPRKHSKQRNKSKGRWPEVPAMFRGSRESSMAGVGPGQGDRGEQGTSLSWKPLKTGPQWKHIWLAVNRITAACWAVTDWRGPRRDSAWESLKGERWQPLRHRC